MITAMVAPQEVVAVVVDASSEIDRNISIHALVLPM